MLQASDVGVRYERFYVLLIAMSGQFGAGFLAPPVRCSFYVALSFFGLFACQR